jgi:branched-chain amino acid transport system substrate-binding protein
LRRTRPAGEVSLPVSPTPRPVEDPNTKIVLFGIRRFQIEKEPGMRRFFVAVTVIALILSFICAGEIVAAKDAGNVVIGAVIPLTGELAKFGEMQKNSYKLALEEINAAGGIKGRKLELLIEDDTGLPEVGRSAVEKLISRDKILVLTGGYSSSVTYGMAAVAQQRKTPYVTHTGAADNITEMRWDYVFRINQPASEYFKGALSFMQEVAKPKTVVVINESSLFGQSQGKSFEEACRALGCKVLFREAFESGSVDFKPLIMKIKAANPDMVYGVCYVMDAALLARQAKELKFNPKLFIGGGGGFSIPELIKNAGDAAEYLFCATLWSETLPFPGAKEYYDNYLKKFGEPPQFQGAQAYVALFVIAEAMKQAKEMTSSGIRDALAQIDMPSMYGPVKFISYGKKTQQNLLPTYLGQWQNQRFETVWPKEFAVKPFLYPVPTRAERK